MSKIKNDDRSSLSYTKWNYKYYIVFTSKYRRYIRKVMWNINW